MTKKHYEAIARILAPFCDNDNYASEQGQEVAQQLATYFESDNPRFDRVRFLKACGIECDIDPNSVQNHKFWCKSHKSYHIG